jgi:hypothetical protein
MKLIAVYDKDGRIVAGVLDSGDYKGPMPVAGPGTHHGAFEVPTESHSSGLEVLCREMRVDHNAKRLVKR